MISWASRRGGHQPVRRRDPSRSHYQGSERDDVCLPDGRLWHRLYAV